MTTHQLWGWGESQRDERLPDAQIVEIGLRSRSAAAHRLDLHGLGIGHLLVAVDVLAWAVAAVSAPGPVGLGLLVLLVLILWLNAVGGLYTPRLALSALDDAAALVGRALVAGAVVTSVRLVAGNGVGTRLVHAAMLFAVLALLGRTVAYAAVRGLRARGRVTHPTLIVGAGYVGGWVAELLDRHPEYGLRPVGFLDSDPLLTPAERGLPVLGDTRQLAKVLHDYDVRDVVVAFSTERESGFIDLLRTCDRYACEIFYVPRLFEMQERGRDLDSIWSLPIARLRRAPFRSVTWRLKRVFDVGAAALAIVILAPALVGCALAVRLQIGGPVLFHQRRVGLDGREFELLKFRTLTADHDTTAHIDWTITRDNRLTAVGRFLRSTSLDELPQLFNILRGDMSVVGPRPERPFFVDQFTERFPRYMARHRVPAGLTGWAQIHGLRGDTSIVERARFDNYYIENWSLWLDVKIILRTVGQVVRRAGA